MPFAACRRAAALQLSGGLPARRHDWWSVSESQWLVRCLELGLGLVCLLFNGLGSAIGPGESLTRVLLVLVGVLDPETKLVKRSSRSTSKSTSARWIGHAVQSVIKARRAES
jgi:hypothetical protein